MIIVSQSKNNIVNFENINLIGLDGEFKIKARLGIHDEVLLGKYKTEERAKEVLQEIIQSYVTNIKAKDAGQFFGFSTIPSNTYYEMPLE